MRGSRMISGTGWLMLLSVSISLLPFVPASSVTPTVHAAGLSFAIGQPFGTGALNGILAVGDINNDGHIDLVIANRDSSAIYLNDGAGNFYAGPLNCAAPPATVRCFGGPNAVSAVQVADMNDDGFLDIVAGGQNIIYLNDPAHPGSFYTGAVDCAAPPANARCFGSRSMDVLSIAVGDLNNDGAFDIVSGNGSLEPSAVYLNYKANGSAIWGSFDFSATAVNCAALAPHTRCFGPTAINTRADVRSLALLDVNGDSFLDIATGNNSAIQDAIYLNDHTGTFPTGVVSCTDTRPAGARCVGRAPILNQTGTDKLAVGDINGDGLLDLITAQGYSTSQSQVIIYIRNASTTTPFYVGAVNCAAPPATVRCFGGGFGSISSVAVGDLNSDGALDLIVGRNDLVNGQNHVHLNNGSGAFPAALAFGTGTDLTNDVAAADVNGDGALDIIANNTGQSAIYTNDQAGIFASDSVSSFGSNLTFSVAVGDVDGDHDLDLVVGNFFGETWIYLNDGTRTFANRPNCVTQLPNARCVSMSQGTVRGVALGDVNGDGMLDIVTVKDQVQSAVYLNKGGGNFYHPTNTNPISCTATPNEVRCFGDAQSKTRSVTLGDMDGDGDLDLVVGQEGGQSAVYLNDGVGNFSTGTINCAALTSVRCFGESAGLTQSVAVGDLNGDGALDIVSGAGGPQDAQSMLYLNDGKGSFIWSGAARPFSSGAQDTRAVVLGDFNGDGALDIAASNHGSYYAQQNVLYLNDGAGNFNWPGATRLFGTGADKTISLASGDLNGDGALDLVVGNEGSISVAYLNDGAGNFVWPGAATSFAPITDTVNALALGDIDGNGTLDIVTGKDVGQSSVYFNRYRQAARLPNNGPTVTITRPGQTPAAAGYSTSEILSQVEIPISYTLADSDGDPVDRVVASYSLDGGGSWLPAHLTSTTETRNLSPGAHIVTWDTFASGVFGQSDNVVVRLVAYPSLRPHTNGVSGPYQWPYATATTFPFRVRGTQVRVVNAQGQAIPDAQVYRLSGGQLRGGERFPQRPAGLAPFATDAQGYLPGRGALTIGDHLVALQPISSTVKYDLFFTSAAPTSSGLDAANVRTAGVQPLTISPANPLILFKLAVSLEWDARNDQQFLVQLKRDIQRASELLYDWTDGQAALGQVTIYHAKQRWGDVFDSQGKVITPAADIQIYASNRLRPNANQGGISQAERLDPANVNIKYEPGQVRIGATWNRNGASSGTIGEDWPRTLAHELGHYALFLDDNYLGIDAQGQLTTVAGCPGAMSDPYRDDYSELVPQDTVWATRCQQTLSQISTKRADWATVAAFYNQSALGFQLQQPASFGKQPGPTALPLTVTTISEKAPADVTTTLEIPGITLVQPDGTPYVASGRTRVMLFSQAGDQVTDLGMPVGSQVLPRGAHPGDELCVYDPDVQQLGCTVLAPTSTQLTLSPRPDWQPDLRITPETSRTLTLALSASGVGSPLPTQLTAKLFPDTGPPVMITLQLRGSEYRGTMSMEQPTLAGTLRLWVTGDSEPRRDVVADYSLGGEPAPRHKSKSRNKRRAPALSSDGQAILFTDNISFSMGTFYTFQTATRLPAAPPWAAPVSQGYYLLASAGAPVLSTTTGLSLSYLEEDVPPGAEGGITIYYQPMSGGSWRRLPGALLNTDENSVTAQAEGAGLYVLMSSLDIQPGWNMVSYPWPQTGSVTQTLALLNGAGHYSTVYGYNQSVPDNPWQVFDVDVPAEWDSLVNDLRELKYGQGYWISALPNTGAAGAPAGLQGALSLPPATYYGVAPGVAPDEQVTIAASVGDVVCGQATSEARLIGGQRRAVFAVKVLAAGAGAAAGCDTPGAPVTIAIMRNDQVIARMPITWDNSRAHQIVGPRTVYIPIIAR